ncbi:MAG: sigma-70 family RNA polymerase sigma factor [Planctomycetes bacterium]|nr:sigma-70 family RNA polymerase sigma factor [Planctomycetota bacterium]
MEATPVSLLERVRHGTDHDAWSRFVKLYTPLIFYWGRQYGLQVADSADLTQEVFTTLVRKLPEFTYDRQKSFRAWLRTLTLNQWRDLHKRRATRPVPGNDDRLFDLKAPDAVSALEEDEYRQHLVQRALRMMQADFQPTTWKAFWEQAVNQRSPDEVAADLGLTIAAVYGAKFRVLNRLRQELRGLLE